MRLASNLDIQNTPVWNEVKNWDSEDKVNLITMLSMSLANSSAKNEMEVYDKNAEVEYKETEAEKTKRMLDKYVGCWEGDDTAEDTIRIINEGRHSSMEPLKF